MLLIRMALVVRFLASTFGVNNQLDKLIEIRIIRLWFYAVKFCMMQIPHCVMDFTIDNKHLVQQLLCGSLMRKLWIVRFVATAPYAQSTILKWRIFGITSNAKSAQNYDHPRVLKRMVAHSLAEFESSMVWCVPLSNHDGWNVACDVSSTGRRKSKTCLTFSTNISLHRIVSHVLKRNIGSIHSTERPYEHTQQSVHHTALPISAAFRTTLATSVKLCTRRFWPARFVISGPLGSLDQGFLS